MHPELPFADALGPARVIHVHQPQLGLAGQLFNRHIGGAGNSFDHHRYLFGFAFQQVEIVPE